MESVHGAPGGRSWRGRSARTGANRAGP